MDTITRRGMRATIFRKAGWLVVASMMATALLAPSASPVLADPAGKVYVCKYVGTPGVNETLQTGQNPIDVSVNAVPDPVVIGAWFNDSQGRSYVLAFDTGQPEPPVTACPPPTPTPKFGSLVVTKALAGDLTGFAGGDFTFSVMCGDTSYGPITINLASGSKAADPITGIPAGAQCTVTETAKPGAGTYGSWDSPSAGSATIVADAPAGVTITNTRTYSPPAPAGSLVVTKALAGDLTGFAGGDFTFSVMCGDTSYGPITINLASGSQSATPITGIPVGAQCTVTETAKPGAGTYGSWDSPSAGSATIVADAPAGVTITNTRTYSPPVVVPTCEQLGTCPVVPTTPTPTGSVEAATSTPAPSAEVLGATGKPRVTPPPTDTLVGTTGQSTGDNWRIVLLGLAAFLASILLLTPTSPERARRRR